MKTSEKVLVVDDNAIQRAMVVKRLQKEGYSVVETGSGAEALELVTDGEIDLMLLDLNMPEMDGHEVLKTLRENYSSLALPVIMVTAEEDTSTIVKSFDLGANDYILKQVSFRIALQRIRTQMALKQLARESANVHKKDAINAMIVTYNHEINNPLAAIYGNLGREFSKLTEPKFERALQSLDRIKDLIKKIKDLDAEKMEYSQYSANTKIFKID